MRGRRLALVAPASATWATATRTPSPRTTSARSRRPQQRRDPLRRFAAKLLPLPGPLAAVPASNPRAFPQPFDVRDPVNTPRGLNPGSETQAALADAVDELRDNAIPLDAPLRGYQYELKGSERVPIHGGPGTLGVFNAISAPFRGREGFPDVTTGSSFVMAAHVNGSRCPESRSILTYSQSANPESRFFADQTRLYSGKRWVDMRFCAEEVLRDRALELGCVADSGFKSVRVRGARGGRVRLAFRRRLRMPVTVEVLRASPGRLRRVARVRRGRSLTLKRRLRKGSYVARFSALGATGKRDRREVAFVVRGRRVRAARRGFSLRERCGTLRSATLGSPVFRGRSIGLRYRLGRGARVSVALVRRGRVVRRVRARSRRPGVRRLSVPSAGLKRGTYGVRIVVRAGKRRSSAVLFSRRL